MEIVIRVRGIWIAFFVHWTRRVCSVGGKLIVQIKLDTVFESIIQKKFNSVTV
jgi:hypothetical protein